MNLKSLILLTPEIILSVAALVLMMIDAFAPAKKKLAVWFSIGSLVAAGLYLIPGFCGNLPGMANMGLAPTSGSAGGWTQFGLVGGMLSVDSISIFFKIAIISAIILILWISIDYYEFQNAPMGMYCSLLIFSTVGMLLLVGSQDLLMAVIALELISIPSFILTGFVANRRSSAEGALKFFLVGTFSTGILLFGISYYYGYFGTTNLAALYGVAVSGSSPDMALSFILTMLVAGLGFKLAMVPFHMWAPDAYEGAPTPVTAFLSVAPKAAAVAFLLRALGQHAQLNLTPVLAVLAAVTMTVGNVGALHQTNIKRLLAYSSIAQVGYILVALVAGGSLGGQATIIYTVLYLFMNLGVFAVLIMVNNKTRNDEIPTFAGLYKKSFGLALALIVFLLSLTGIPPLAGFVGKFAIFAAVIKAEGLLWLGIVAVLNSVVSLYYYFKLAHQAFFKDAVDDASSLQFSPALMSCLAVSLAITVIAGLLPNSLLHLVRMIVG